MIRTFQPFHLTFSVEESPMKSRVPLSLFREKQTDAEDSGLASSPLQLMHSDLSLSEKQEDADNQKNSTRASQAGLNNNAIHIPVTVTSPPGETTIIPSEYRDANGLLSF